MAFRDLATGDDALAATLRDFDDRLRRLENGGAIAGQISLDSQIRIGDVIVTVAEGQDPTDRTLTFTNALTGATIDPAASQPDVLFLGSVFNDVPIVGTTEAAAGLVVGGSNVTYDGGPVTAQFYAPAWNNGNVQHNIVIVLREGATVVADVYNDGAGALVTDRTGINGFLPFTPTAGVHKYEAACYSDGGTCVIRGGPLGPGQYGPMFLKITRDA